MYQIYQVQSYDTLQSIADRFNTTVDEIKKINGIKEFTPILGAPLIVPKITNQHYENYIVKKGDSLYSISKKYNTEPNVLALLNGLDKDDYIYPNQQIIVPKGVEGIYVVKEGENLNNILKKLNISIDELMNLNDNILLEDEQIIFYKRDKSN